MDDPAVALERINGFQEACLLFFHCVLKTYTWVVDMSTHQQAMCAHSNSTLRAKERKCLTLVEFTFAGTHKFHWNNNMSFENSPILRVTGLKACLAVFYNACHTFHQCRFFLANIALQFAFRRGGLLTSNPFVLLGLLKLLDHILKGEVEWKPVHSTGHAANCTAYRTLDIVAVCSRAMGNFPKSSSTIQTYIVRIATRQRPRVREKHQANWTC
mmetsp:Transcript_46820/g.124554  ORF Transcript_46820/g.124554 Transcript_46820/m.124554 type:complete len:214 (-) Transcript_46820:68-709(-)